MINQKGGKKIMEKERVYEKIVINAGWIKSNTVKTWMAKESLSF